MSTPTDIDGRLRRAHAQVEAPDDAATARVLASLERALRAEATTAPAPGRARRWRFAFATVAVVALIAAAGAAVLTGGETGDRGDGRAPAGGPRGNASTQLACLDTAAGNPNSCLRALGKVAGGRPPIPAGQVIYQRNVFTISIAYISASGKPTGDPENAAYAVSRTVPEEMWLAPDGSGRFAYGPESSPKPASTTDERAWRAAGSPDLDTLVPPPGEWGPKVQDFGKGEMDRALIFNSNLEAVLPADDPLSVLPHEPDKLAEFLQRAAAKQREGGPASDISNTLGTNVTTFLRYPRTPPDLRKSLLEVFATLPGSRLLGKVRDGADREAAGIQLPRNYNDGQDVVVFDPESARLLGEGMAVGDGGVRWLYAYAVESGTVDAIGDRP